MFIGVVEPLLAPDHMRDLHLPVINHIGQVKGRPSVSPHYYKVIQEFKFQRAVNLIPERCRSFFQICLDTNRKGLPITDASSDVRGFQGPAFTVVRTESTLFRAKAGISFAFREELIPNLFVDLQSLALNVGTAVSSVKDRFVGRDSKPVQHFEDVLGCSWDLPTLSEEEIPCLCLRCELRRFPVDFWLGGSYIGRF